MFVYFTCLQQRFFDRERHGEHNPDCLWFSLFLRTTLLFKMLLPPIIWCKFLFLLEAINGFLIVIHNTRSSSISQKQDGHNLYVIMKILCPPGYHHNVFVATHTIGHMIEGYRLLLLMNQRLLYKPVKERNVSSHKWSTTQILLKFHRRFITTRASWQPLHLGR